MKKIAIILCLFLVILHSGQARSQAEYGYFSELTLSHDGSRIAITGRFLPDNSLEDGGIFPIDVFDVHTGDLIKSVASIVPRPENIRLNRDGSLLAFSTRLGDVEIMDIQSEAIVATLQAGGAKEAEGHNWSPSGDLIALISGVTVSIRDMNIKFATLYDEEIPIGVNGLAWNSSGTQIATSVFNDQTEEGLIVVWDINAGNQFTPQQRIPGGGGRGIAWSSDNQYIATNTRGGINIYSMGDGTVRAFLLPDPNEVIFPVDWSPDGQYIAGGGDGVWVWDTQTGDIVANYPTEFPVTSVAWSPDGHLYHNGGSAGVYRDGIPLQEALAVDTITVPPTDGTILTTPTVAAGSGDH